jgi:Glyoxalase-like domain
MEDGAWSRGDTHRRSHYGSDSDDGDSDDDSFADEAFSGDELGGGGAGLSSRERSSSKSKKKKKKKSSRSKSKSSNSKKKKKKLEDEDEEEDDSRRHKSKSSRSHKKKKKKSKESVVEDDEDYERGDKIKSPKKKKKKSKSDVEDDKDKDKKKKKRSKKDKENGDDKSPKSPKKKSKSKKKDKEKEKSKSKKSKSKSVEDTADTATATTDELYYVEDPSVNNDDNSEAERMKKMLAQFDDSDDDSSSSDSSDNNDDDAGTEEGEHKDLKTKDELGLRDNEIDHIILAAPDYEEAVKEFETMTGIKPARLGGLKGLGIRAARVATDNNCYIEILAPDPVKTGPIGDKLKELEEGTLIHYAVRQSELDDLQHEFVPNELGYETDRINLYCPAPDGSPAKWGMLFMQGHFIGGVVPYYVDWGKCAHPISSIPTVGPLKSLTITAPGGSQVHKILKNIDLVTTVEGNPAMEFCIGSPEGTITFAGEGPEGLVFPGRCLIMGMVFVTVVILPVFSHHPFPSLQVPKGRRKRCPILPVANRKRN